MLSRMSERRDTYGEKIMCEMETPKKISWRTRKKEEKKRAKMRMKGAMREHDGARNEEWRQCEALRGNTIAEKVFKKEKREKYERGNNALFFAIL